MESENGVSGFLTWMIILVVGFFILKSFGGCKYEGQTAEEWFNDYDYEVEKNEELENRISDFEMALGEANNNIEEANSIIERARGYAWYSYNDMGWALEDLTTVDTISEP